jgi:hypothetical protein
MFYFVFNVRKGKSLFYPFWAPATHPPLPVFDLLMTLITRRPMRNSVTSLYDVMQSIGMQHQCSFATRFRLAQWPVQPPGTLVLPIALQEFLPKKVWLYANMAPLLDLFGQGKKQRCRTLRKWIHITERVLPQF